MWKNSKISCLEYLMWINIYGNRSFNDISQYPVFPWIITNYNTETFQDIINNKNIRNFNLPIGLLSLNEKGKERVEGYILTYKYMCHELNQEEQIKIKENEEKDLNKEDQKNIDNENMEDKITNITLNKIPKYNFDIEKIYKNISLDYEKIPYLFGSHYSNAMYISHYMCRLFPYSLTMIEIQGIGFDVSERLFICLQKTFTSASTENCDLRELIPDFYSMPEFFMNINNLNFGSININNYFGAVSYYEELSEQKDEKGKILINDVLLPKWCKDNPYIYIMKSRELLEDNNEIDLNPWIDLIFGYTQRGRPAQQVGNLFLPSAYDGVINLRLKDDDVLKNRNEAEYKLRLFELGVNPTKVFDKKLYEKKRVINKEISNIYGEIGKNFNYIADININFISNIVNNFTLIYLEKDYLLKKIIIEERIEIKNGYKIKEIGNYSFIN